ncbi:MAG: DNA cytosine methyltransferase, partial [Candidatus Zixiibacteriota bacterium]
MNEYFEKLIIDPEERANFQFYETSSGLLLTESCIRDRKPIAIDLFAGAGGFSLGLIQAGFNVIAALENDMPSIHTYLVNLGAFPVEMHFIEESDAVRAEKYFKKAIMKEESGVISISGVSGSNRQLACHDMPWFPGVRHMFVGDARKITGGEILKKIGYKRGDVDLVVGGPPCQGFTFANKKRCPEDPRNNLTLEFIRLVLDIQPKTFCMENVPG